MHYANVKLRKKCIMPKYYWIFFILNDIQNEEKSL